MFDNPGGQIQRLAKIIFWLSFIAAFVIGFIVAKLFFGNSEYFIPILIIIITVGLVVSWFSVIFMFAFGALVENSEIVRQNTEFTLDKLSIIEGHLRNISVYLSLQDAEDKNKEKESKS